MFFSLYYAWAEQILYAINNDASYAYILVAKHLNVVPFLYTCMLYLHDFDSIILWASLLQQHN